jgi:hypothetical protein
MWGEKRVGDKSITTDQLRKGDHFLIPEQKAVPFDTNAGWKEGGVYNVGFAVHDDKITDSYLMV